MTDLAKLRQRRHKRVRKRNHASQVAKRKRDHIAKDRRELRKAKVERAKNVKAIEKLDRLIEENQAQSNVVKISGNRATGGTDRQRLKAIAERACELDAIHGNRFYSQAGAWTVQYGITGEPVGYRSDCSQIFLSWYWSAGLPDPTGYNYTAGWTGTLGASGREISRSQLQPGDAILYGPYPHFHVEMYLGPDPITAGHGSRPVDKGTIDMINAPRTYRTYL